jgi:hypothetical protein
MKILEYRSWLNTYPAAVSTPRHHIPNYAQPWTSWVQLALKGIGINPIAAFGSGSFFGSSYTTTTIQAKT